MNPLQTLSAIPDFSGAELMEQLSDGLTHRSFVIRHLEKTFVLRIDKPMAQALSLNRLSEFEVQKVAARAGLAPELFYQDIENGILIREYLPGASWSETELRQAGNLELLASLLRKLHSLPATGSPYDPLAAMERYAAQTGSPTAGSLILKARRFCEEIKACSSEAVPCHNDLVYHNILQSGDRLMILDWEYAGVGDPFFDLAIVIQHHGLSDDLSRSFLQNYLGRNATTAESLRLGLQCQLYEVLLTVWLERVTGGPLSRTPIRDP